MQWLLVVGWFEANFLSGSNITELLLNLNPPQEGIDLNKAVFKCVAVDTRGRRYQEIISIFVEGMHNRSENMYAIYQYFLAGIHIYYQTFLCGMMLIIPEMYT